MTIIRFYLASKDRNGEDISPEKLEFWRNTVEKAFALKFGGFTEFETTGGYLNQKGCLIVEKTLVIESHTEKFSNLDSVALKYWAYAVKCDLRQETVMIQAIETEKTEFV